MVINFKFDVHAIFSYLLIMRMNEFFFVNISELKATTIVHLRVTRVEAECHMIRKKDQEQTFGAFHSHQTSSACKVLHSHQTSSACKALFMGKEGI